MTERSYVDELSAVTDAIHRALEFNGFVIRDGTYAGQLAQVALEAVKKWRAPTTTQTQALLEWAQLNVEQCKKEVADCQRYADWQRSPEGQAKRRDWVGQGPGSGDADVAFFQAELAQYEAVVALLEGRTA